MSEFFAGAGLAGLFIFFICAGMGFLLVLKAYLPGYSYHYRKYLVNLYIAGKIKQLADKDNVNLNELMVDLEKYVSLGSRKRIRDLDDKIEQELMKKIEDESNENKKSKS